MPNIGKIFKDEIVRLSRKNAVGLGKSLKTEMRGLKKQIRTLSISLKNLENAFKKAGGRSPSVSAEETTPAGRAFTGKGIKALRRKFKITQAQLAQLANVSAQAVVMWERKNGKIRFRHATYEALSSIRIMRKADVKAALAKTPVK